MPYVGEDHRPREDAGPAIFSVPPAVPCSVLAPWASEPEVKWAQEEIELFHLNFWSSQGGFL